MFSLIELYFFHSGGGLGTIRGFSWASILPLHPRGHVVHTWSGDAVDWLLDLMELMVKDLLKLLIYNDNTT